MTHLFYKQLASSLIEENDIFLFTIIAGNSNLIGEKLLLIGSDAIASNPFTMLLWDNILQKVHFEKYPYIFSYADDIKIFFEHISKKPNLILFGGGHISTHVAKIANMINFNVTVVDDREAYANSTRFPKVHKIYCMPFKYGINSINFTNSTYSVIVTRGHENDKQCLEEIINKPNAYIGMIGSRKKVKLIMDALIKEGYDKTLLDKVYAPIGLRIKAETPEEIAISIVGELIKVKNSNESAQYFEQDILDKLQVTKKSYVVATIIDRKGSSPRNVGARMLVTEDKKIYGTIGGGSLEHKVFKKSLELLSSHHPNSLTVTCDMTNEDASSSGMICGGSVDVFLDLVIVD